MTGVVIPNILEMSDVSSTRERFVDFFYYLIMLLYDLQILKKKCRKIEIIISIFCSRYRIENKLYENPRVSLYRKHPWTIIISPAFILCILSPIVQILL